MTAENENRKHIAAVARYLHFVAARLLTRADNHDASKLEEPEASGFEAVHDRLAGLTYGSLEYKQSLDDLKPTLDHHYADSRNMHHPEHHPNGIDDMTLIDVIEMVCDWKASTKRHADGDMPTSIAINAKRFNMSPQLTRIIENTAADLAFHDALAFMQEQA